MNNMNRLTAVLALAGAILAAGAGRLQAEGKGNKGRRTTQFVERRIKSLARKYRATDAQKARLAKLAAAHIHALEALDRVNSERGKDLQRKIDPLQSKLPDLKRQAAEQQAKLRRLQDEMQKLENDRKALLARQADELEAVITEQQRMAYRANELIRRHVRKIWDELDDGKRQRVTRAARDAAGKIARAEPKTRRDVERAAVRQLIDALEKIIGPAMTGALREDAINRAIGPYRRANLTDEQKEKILDLTERFNAEQAKRQSQVADLEAKLKSFRLELSRKAPSALKKAVMEEVLTPEQRRKFKPKAPKDRTQLPRDRPFAITTIHVGGQ